MAARPPRATSSVGKPATKRHLYVVLDDHKDSYGIHKLDMDDDGDGDLEGSHASSPRRLPVLPALSVALSTLGERAQFAAVGKRIVAIGRKPEGYSIYDGQVLMYEYDTKTGEMVVSPKLPDGLRNGYMAAMAVGQRMYFLESISEMYCLLNMVYPTGAQVMEPYVDTVVTYSFSTASGEWTRLGNWHLPFVGYAHYDGELDAWLGLHAANQGNRYCPCLMNGHLCAGNIWSAPSEWKVGSEKLFRHDEHDAAAGWRHYDAKLVPMAPGQDSNEYCLMERLRPEGDHDEGCLCDGDDWLLRLTVFRVGRGQDGEPIVTARRRSRSYKVSRHNEYFNAQSFWM